MAKSKPASKEKASEAEAPAVAVSASSAGSATPNYQVLARRYRSRDFDELVGQDAIARTLQNAIRTGRTAHAYLFTGTRGVGKTSMARIFARALNATEQLTQQVAVADAIMRGEDIDVIEIDAASNRGIDNARDLIAGAGLMPARGRYKIYIIDEVHMLTTPAFNALLKTMEEPPSHVKFILCTTEPQSVPATIQSRCQRFDFRAIPATRIAAHLRDVLSREKAEAEERVVMQVARMANGSMRDSLSLLERLLAAAVPDDAGHVQLTWQLLEDIFGLPDESLVERIVDAIGRADAKEALQAGGELLERGMSIERALDLLAERFRWMMIATVCGAESELLEIAAETRETVARLAKPFDPAALVHLIAMCDSVASKARDASSPRALYDAAIVRMCLSESFANAAALLASGGTSGAAAGGVRPPGKAAPRAAEPAVRPAAPSLAAAAPTPLTPTPTAGPTRAQPTASVIEPKPAERTPAAPPCATNAEGFWAELVAKAASSPRDGALLSSLRCKSWDGQTLMLAVHRGEAGSGFLSSNLDMVRTVMRRLAGRTIDVRIEMEAASTPVTPAAQRGVIPQEVREHPVVKLASDLFDAVVVDWAPRVKDAGPAESDSERGLAADVGADASSDHAIDDGSGEHEDV